MRLIHVETLELREFNSDKIPPYAILSHRWEGDEITFKDVKKSRNLDSRGWAKVRTFCQFVQVCRADLWWFSGTLDWVWVDTCCIDKRSSAELSEAINSMFQWYKNAVVCYVYLNDVDYGEEDEVHQALRKSQWFTRGWTLQELVAPRRLCFVDARWTGVLGDEDSLAEVLVEITGIGRETAGQSDFESRSRLGSFSVAQRMSWASGRVCQRAEDQAYCLMGLFEVNMPLLYGEGGHRAFQRLQQEILRSTDDESLFAWFDDDSMVSGMLADSPTYFKHSGNIVRGLWDSERPEFTITNKGLRFVAPADHDFPWTSPGNKEYELRPFALNCYTIEDKTQPIGLVLVRIGPCLFRRYQSRNIQFSRKTRKDLLAQLEDFSEGERLYCQS